MNKTILTGRTTKEIELKTTQNGTNIARFTLAVNRRKKDDGADFINCVAYAKVAELLSQYVHKGDRIGVVGRIQTGSYEKDGHKIYTTDVIVEEFDFQESKRQEKEEFVPVVDGKDLPF